MHFFSLTLDRHVPSVEVLVAQFSNEQTIESLLDILYTDPRSSRRRASAIILRPCVSEHFTSADLKAAMNSGIRKPGVFLDAVTEACSGRPKAFARFEDVPIFVLFSDNFEHRLSENINASANVPRLVESHLTDYGILETIRTAELDCLVTRSHALLMPVEGAYYDPPSHRPVRSFLRVGNIQYSRQAVDALAFWLLPYVHKAQGILIDTWSISSIAFNLSRLLNLYDGRAPVPVEMLSQYQDRTAEAQGVLQEVLDRLWSECDTSRNDAIPITCIVSATQTGSLVDVLKEEIDLAGLSVDMTFVALFQLGKTDALPSLCDRSNDPEFAPLSSANVEKRSAIHIDPQVYFPLAYRDIEFKLRRKHTKSFAAFTKRFGIDLFSAHRDQSSDGPARHHAVHLDMAALVSHPVFQKAFDAEISALRPSPSVVLTPQHVVAQSLGARAVAILASMGKEAMHLQHPHLLLRKKGPFREAEDSIRSVLATLTDEDSLLIVDDCFITGDRLWGYQNHLRQLNVKARLHYRVGVARPENLDDWHECQTMLAFRDDADKRIYESNTTAAIHELCLPNWQQADCPWCAEAALYQRMLKDGQVLPKHIQHRLDRLTDRDPGLVNDLFLVGPGDSSLELYGGSIFLPPSTPQATVFAAIGSALQQLRTLQSERQPSLGPRRYPIATVLKAREYLKDVYTDSILRAAVLRAGCSEELVYMDDTAERKRTGLITKLMTSSKADERDISLELVLAHAAGKCAIDQSIDLNLVDKAAVHLLKIVRAISS